MFYTSQSATSTFLECPRKRWFQYHSYGTGISSVQPGIPLLTGSCVHEAIEVMIKDYIKNKRSQIDVELGIREGIIRYNREVKDVGLSQTLDQFQVQTQTEQKALVEVLIRLWVLCEWPVLIKYYKILAVEFQILYPISDNIIFQSKPDLLLIHKGSDQLINYSLKTLKGLYVKFTEGTTITTEDMYSIGNQTVTEPFCTSWYLNKKFGRDSKIPTNSSGIRFCYLIKGERKSEGLKGSGKKYTTDNPFLYAYKKVGLVNIEYAWSFWTINPNNKSGYGRLGKGWDKFTVFEGDGNSLKNWIEALRSGAIANDLGDGKGSVFEQHCKSSPEVYMPAWITKRRMFQIEELEKRIFSLVEETLQYQDPNEQLFLDDKFPMNTQSCYFPSKCEYLTICPNGNKDYRTEIAENPFIETEVGPLYKIRVPHHKAEKENFEKEGFLK